MYKFVFIKIKNFCASKSIIKKVKRQPTEWKKIFANQISGKDLINIYIKNSQKSTKGQPNLKSGQRTQIFLQRIHKTVKYTPEIIEREPQRDTCTPMFIAVFFIVVISGNNQVSINR